MPTDKPSAERAAREFLRGDEWRAAKIGSDAEINAVTKLLADYAALAVERERLDCAKAVCWRCADIQQFEPAKDKPMGVQGDLGRSVPWRWTHQTKSHTGLMQCQAAAIWARDAERG